MMNPTNIMAAVADRVLGHNPTSTRQQPKTHPTEKMKAIVWRGKFDMRYEEVPRPMVSEPHDILLKVTATTICGSDLHLYTGELPGMESGDIVGHEFMGIVVDKGQDVQLPIGTRVVVAFDIACGFCDFCKREEYTSCDTTNPSKVAETMFGHALVGVFGYGHMVGGYWGGQAEYVRVPFADLNCLPIPDDVPDEKALYLSDVIPTSYHACEMGEVKQGDKVGIWGMGPIGLAAARWAQILGASTVVCISGTEDRLDIARNLGCVVINYHEQDPVDTISKMFPQGLDVCIDAAGFRFAKSMVHKVQRALMLETDTPEIITECCKCCRKNGKVSVIGDYPGTCNSFPIGMIAMKHLRLESGQSPTQRIWKMALEKLRTGEYDPSFFVTHTMTLKDVPDAYKQFYNREGGMVKIFVRP